MTRAGFWVVIGAGGHAAVVVSTIQAMGGTVRAIFDDDPRRHGSKVLGVPVIGPVGLCRLEAGEQAILGVGDNGVRRDLAAKLSLSWGVAIHPSALVHSSVTIGGGSVVFAGTVIQPRTVVGRHVIVNTAASVDHDGLLEDFCHVAPGAHLSGHVTIREGALMGVGSAAIPGAIVGAWTVVGAGGAVVGELPAGTVCVGVPARPRAKKA
ncbi:MAG: NeuD/PglB/VioB family sugar acetyltransferase [Thermoanaerobaculia bacterium]